MTKPPVSDPENPEWTEADFARAVPFDQAFPDLADSARRERGRPKSENPKQAVNLRLDPDVLEYFRAQGPGWQTRINAILRAAAGLETHRP